MSAVLEKPVAGKPSASISVQPLSVHIGAEVRGLDLSRPLGADTVAHLRATLLQW